ncbi:hypothetical protein Hanom_Chr14g01336641 [Helianthus anomalus]
MADKILSFCSKSLRVLITSIDNLCAINTYSSFCSKTASTCLTALPISASSCLWVDTSSINALLCFQISFECS